MACLALYLCNRVRRCVNNKAGDRTTVRSPCAACACACAHIVDVASDSDSFNGKNKRQKCALGRHLGWSDAAAAWETRNEWRSFVRSL